MRGVGHRTQPLCSLSDVTLSVSGLSCSVCDLCVQIVEGSRAENSALLEGDIVLSVNGISCGGSQAGQQLIDSAFRTLTLKVLR